MVTIMSVRTYVQINVLFIYCKIFLMNNIKWLCFIILTKRNIKTNISLERDTLFILKLILTYIHSIYQHIIHIYTKENKILHVLPTKFTRSINKHIHKFNQLTLNLAYFAETVKGDLLQPLLFWDSNIGILHVEHCICKM